MSLVYLLYIVPRAPEDFQHAFSLCSWLDVCVATEINILILLQLRADVVPKTAGKTGPMLVS